MSDAGILAGRRLRIVFRREADRIAHVVQSIEDGSFVTWLESVEGTADEAWPASPPCQEIHFERREGDRQLALSIGMAGQSHWSVSVELNAEGDRATFDVACRVRARPAKVGSFYRIPDDRAAACQMASSTRIHLGAELAVLAAADLQTSFRVLPPDGLKITPRAADNWPATIRWKYEIAAADPHRYS